jgi:hypothetical protein
MPPFLYRCPNTGFRVEGYAPDDDKSEGTDNVFVGVNLPRVRTDAFRQSENNQDGQRRRRIVVLGKPPVRRASGGMRYMGCPSKVCRRPRLWLAIVRLPRRRSRPVSPHPSSAGRDRHGGRRAPSPRMAHGRPRLGAGRAMLCLRTAACNPAVCRLRLLPPDSTRAGATIAGAELWSSVSLPTEAFDPASVSILPHCAARPLVEGSLAMKNSANRKVAYQMERLRAFCSMLPEGA